MAGNRTDDGRRGAVDSKMDMYKKKLLEAFKLKKGLVYQACRYAKIDPTTYYRYREQDQDFADAIDAICEEIVDDVEEGLMKLMEDQDHHVQVKARNIFLAAKGRKRGYGTQKQELTGEGGGPAVVYVNVPSNSRIPPRD